MSTLRGKKKAKAKSKKRAAAKKQAAPTAQDQIPAAGGTAGPDVQQVPPVEGPAKTKATKKQALASRKKKNAKPSTAVAGAKPSDPTDKKGNFTGTPGEDIQLRDPLAPTETRNTVVSATHSHKPETNANRSIAAHMEKVAPGVADNLDVRAVAPANVDKDNLKGQADAQKTADKISADQEKARLKAQGGE